MASRRGNFVAGRLEKFFSLPETVEGASKPLFLGGGLVALVPAVGLRLEVVRPDGALLRQLVPGRE